MLVKFSKHLRKNKIKHCPMCQIHAVCNSVAAKLKPNLLRQVAFSSTIIKSKGCIPAVFYDKVHCTVLMLRCFSRVYSTAGDCSVRPPSSGHCFSNLHVVFDAQDWPFRWHRSLGASCSKNTQISHQLFLKLPIFPLLPGLKPFFLLFWCWPSLK